MIRGFVANLAGARLLGAESRRAAGNLVADNPRQTKRERQYQEIAKPLRGFVASFAGAKLLRAASALQQVT